MFIQCDGTYVLLTPGQVEEEVMSAPTPLPTSSNLRLSARFADVGFSEIVRIRNRVLELKAAGETIHQFEGGEPFFETPEPIKEAMRRALAENKTRYAPSSGIPPLIEAIVDKVRTMAFRPSRRTWSSVWAECRGCMARSMPCSIRAMKFCCRRPTGRPHAISST